jgi:hypothetical protein
MIGLLASAAMVAGPAQAQSQDGLVNINIDDVTAQVPVAAAANICSLSVLVLVQKLLLGGSNCKSGAIALAKDNDGHGGWVDQDGLINVNLTNVDAQVPIAVAANICGTTVDVLASGLLHGPVDCSAFGRSATVSD